MEQRPDSRWKFRVFCDVIGARGPGNIIHVEDPMAHCKAHAM